jgi:hypothetical protein
MATPALTRITAQDAENDAHEDRTFAERPAVIPAAQFPKRSYAISVQSPAGFPITITLNDMKLDQLDDALATLLDRGYMPAEVPSVLTPPNAPQAAQASAQPASDGQQAVCPYHGPMKESTIKGKEGTYYCPKKMADDTYCKERWPKW